MEGPRGTKKEEFNQVLILVNYVFRKHIGIEHNMGKWYPLLFNEDNLENMRIIIEDNKPVSHIGISECEITIYGCRTKIGSIGSVCTYPEYRKRGLATLLLEDSMRKLDKDEVDIMLVSGGRGLYKRASCVEAGRVYNFKIFQNEIGKLNNQEVEILPYKEENLEDMVKVYQRESVRFFRSLEYFERILNTGAAMDRKAEILTIQKADELLGYLAVQLPEKGKGKKVSKIAEYSGVRGAIVEAVKCIFDRYNLQELNFNIPFYDEELIYMFKKMGFKSAMVNIPGTIKIINFPRLMKRFHPYIEERLGKKKADLLKFSQQDDKFTIRFNQEQFNTDASKLAQIVFGTYNEREREMIPKEGKMAKVLRTIFPLPFIWPGLNYV